MPETKDTKLILYTRGRSIGNYENYQAALTEIITKADELTSSQKKGIEKYIDELADVSEPSFLDTSIGGNEVLNPYPCGNENDDIIFPINAIDKSCTRGLGCVYKEVIQDTQKVLWLTFGIPKFNNLEAFYGLSGGDEDAGEYAKAINEGSDSKKGLSLFGSLSGFGSFIGDSLKTAGKLAINLPFLPIRAYNWITDNIDNDEITKYYDFEPAMGPYYKQVNSVIGELAVGMGLYGNGSSAVTSTVNVANEAFGTGSAVSTIMNTGAKTTADAEKSPEYLGVPEILKNGPDIFSIMDKRRRWQDGKSPVRNMDNPDNYVETALNFAKSLASTSYGADQFIGFRVEKSTDTYESITNTTGESQVASLLNNTSQEVRAATFSFMGASFNTQDGYIAKVADVIKNVGQGAVKLVGDAIGRPNFEGTGTTLFTGNGYFDIPEVWKNSSFTKSYTFSIELESRLGDPVSVYQNLYVPLAALICAAAPRAVGKNMYSSPFILQAYCQGMFAIPLGIIDSITIKRGSADYGWTYNGLPTTINVSFTIKDLSPAMFLSLFGESFTGIFQNNSSMHEYLATLSGLGLADRKRFGSRIMRKYNAALLLARTTLANPIFWATNWGSSKFCRTVGNVFHNALPTN